METKCSISRVHPRRGMVGSWVYFYSPSQIPPECTTFISSPTSLLMVSFTYWCLLIKRSSRVLNSPTYHLPSVLSVLFESWWRNLCLLQVREHIFYIFHLKLYYFTLHVEVTLSPGVDFFYKWCDVKVKITLEWEGTCHLIFCPWPLGLSKNRDGKRMFLPAVYVETSKYVLTSTPGKGASHTKVRGEEHSVVRGKAAVLVRDQVMEGLVIHLMEMEPYPAVRGKP